MTGEITLRGQVLRIGGLKEKVLAAHRSGLRTIVLPRRNEQDLDDVPDEIKQSMKFILVDTVDDVIEASLEPAKGQKKAKKTAKTKTKTSSREKKTNVKSIARRR
jgi:ATP-dependent Lon protease